MGPGKGLLSFGGEDDDGDGDNDGKSSTRGNSPSLLNENTLDPVKRKLTPNPHAGRPAPKVMTKAALAAQATERERLRKEFLQVQEKVRNTEVAIPFVFYDGSNIPGGTARVKKGDHVWLFLERCRKVGAEMGVGPDGRKSWARIGVDDLMCVRGEVIVPHHYEFYYFIANMVEDPTKPGRQLFDYSGTVASGSTTNNEEALLFNPKDVKVEGMDDEPAYTKVVDRRWYEKNKHIYPASLWKEYKTGKEFEESMKSRKDALGNSFFFS